MTDTEHNGPYEREDWHAKRYGIFRVATAIEKLNSRTLLGQFPGLLKQWCS